MIYVLYNNYYIHVILCKLVMHCSNAMFSLSMLNESYNSIGCITLHQVLNV